MTATATWARGARTISGPPRGRRALDVIVFTAVTFVGLARVPESFFGDQALNALMGKVIASGGAPYADLWDLKHPGVFFFFAAGGMLFGFDEVGIHLFELLWMLVTALAVRVMAGRWFTGACDRTPSVGGASAASR
jgi:hypothetical protein